MTSLLHIAYVVLQTFEVSLVAHIGDTQQECKEVHKIQKQYSMTADNDVPDAMIEEATALDCTHAECTESLVVDKGEIQNRVSVNQCI